MKKIRTRAKILGFYESAPKRQSHHFNLNKLSLKIAGALGFAALGMSGYAHAACTEVTPSELYCDGSYSVYWTNLDAYDKVTIDLAGNWGTAPDIQGIGYYINGDVRTVNVDELNIKTNGRHADAIRTNNTYDVTYNGKVNIQVSNTSFLNFSSDGVNLTTTSNGMLKFNGDVSISALGSYSGSAVRVNRNQSNNINQAIFNGDLTILTQAAGQNTSDTRGYGLVAGSEKNPAQDTKGGAQIIANGTTTITTSGGNAYAVFANNEGKIQVSDINVTTTGNAAHGMVAYVGGVTGKNFTGGHVYLTRNATINVDATKGSYAIHASGTDSLVTSGKIDGTSASGVFNVRGNLVADTGGTIDLTTTSGSSFVSNVRSDNATINLNGIASYTGNFTATNNGTIDLSGKPSVVGSLIADTGGTINSALQTGSTFIGNVSADNGAVNLNGVASYTGNFTATNNGTIALSGKPSVVGNLIADTGGTINSALQAGSTFIGNVSADNGAINLNGVASYTGDFTATNNGTIALSGTPSVVGDLIADTGGTIDVVALDNTYLRGRSDTSSGAGTINLSMTGSGSEWNMTGDSTITNLNLANGAKITFEDLSRDPIGTNSGILTIEHLTGSGEFHVGANILRDGPDPDIAFNQADKILITGSSNGAHKLFVHDINSGGLTPTGTEAIRIIDSVDQGASFALGNVLGRVDYGPYSYELAREDLKTRSAKGYWSLIPKALTPTAQNSVGLLSTNYLLSYTETQTLLQRMGELRSPGHKGDVWGRVYTGKLSSFDDGRIGGHDLSYHGMQFGVDRQLDLSADGQVYVGGMIGYTTGKTDYNVGSGKTDGYHIGVYGTYMMENGFYIDGLLKYQH
ncbi:MAG: autotransporter outer membrane beta-barrel domain-containing protein, partial [Saezia sp.]